LLLNFPATVHHEHHGKNKTGCKFNDINYTKDQSAYNRGHQEKFRLFIFFEFFSKVFFQSLLTKGRQAFAERSYRRQPTMNLCHIVGYFGCPPASDKLFFPTLPKNNKASLKIISALSQKPIISV
jgi:hypothetical protein